MRLKELREKNRLTQAACAKLFNVSPRGYVFWENGDREPKLDILVRMADYFEVTMDYLLGRVPNVDAYTINEEAIIVEFQKMSIEQQQEVITYAKFVQKK